MHQVQPVFSDAIAIIPARGGSKRVPDKNIRVMNGQPALWWVIQSAFNSGQFSRIVVSTDDEDTSDIARTAGAEVPFLRPAELGGDAVPLREVIRHSLSCLYDRGDDNQSVCCLYATAVLLDPTDLSRSFTSWMTHEQFTATIAVTAYPHPIERAMHLSSSGQVSFIEPDNAVARTQDLGVQVYDAAQFCWASRSTWLGPESILNNALGYRVPSWRAVDIDDEDDWTHATLLHYALENLRKSSD